MINPGDLDREPQPLTSEQLEKLFQDTFTTAAIAFGDAFTQGLGDHYQVKYELSPNYEIEFMAYASFDAEVGVFVPSEFSVCSSKFFPHADEPEWQLIETQTFTIDDQNKFGRSTEYCYYHGDSGVSYWPGEMTPEWTFPEQEMPQIHRGFSQKRAESQLGNACTSVDVEEVYSILRSFGFVGR